MSMTWHSMDVGQEHVVVVKINVFFFHFETFQLNLNFQRMHFVHESTPSKAVLVTLQRKRSNFFKSVIIKQLKQSCEHWVMGRCNQMIMTQSFVQTTLSEELCCQWWLLKFSCFPPEECFLGKTQRRETSSHMQVCCQDKTLSLNQ